MPRRLSWCVRNLWTRSVPLFIRSPLTFFYSTSTQTHDYMSICSSDKHLFVITWKMTDRQTDRQTDRLAPLCRLQHMIKDAIRPSYVASISNDAFSFRHQIYVAPDAKVKTPHKRPTAYTTYNLRYHWLIDFHDILVYYSLTWQRGGIEAYSESCDVTRLTYAICTWSIEWWCATTQFAPIPPLLPFVGLSNV